MVVNELWIIYMGFVLLHTTNDDQLLLFSYVFIFFQ
jgi:hypothetical protein